MLDRFLAAYPLTDGHPGSGSTLAEVYGGCTFGGGAYRVHSAESATQAHEWIAAGFPAYAGRVSCFGFDWLGRQFALDQRVRGADSEVLLIEPGTGEVLEIPVPFSQFHDSELVEYGDDALALPFFAQAEAAGLTPRFDQCVGYKVPLFLGGKDDLTNLELIDSDVYWTLSAQLIAGLL